MKKILFFSAAFFVYIIVHGQDNAGQIIEIIENSAGKDIDNELAEPDYESMIAELENFRKNPVDLNTANASELEKLWLLTDFQILSLLDYRKSIGKINSIYELNYIYGFNKETVDLISPFVFTGETIVADSLNDKIKYNSSSNELLIRAAHKNNSENNYSGNPLQLYTRLTGNRNDRVFYSFLAEKDAGEEFAKGSNNTGFDFYSGFLQLKTKSIIKTVIIGDYRVRAGQGLLIWNGYSASKSSGSLHLQKRGQGVTGNSSKDEYNFLRGVAAVTSFKNFTFTFFGSDKNIDGTLDSLEGVYGIKTINTSGYHRTTTETLRKGNTREQVLGSIINFRTEKVSASMNWLHTNYEYSFIQSEETYKLHNFKGNICNGVSADYRLLFQKFQFFGEAALSNNSLAALNGINFMVASKFTGTVFYRNYPSSYFSPYSNAISENTATHNEEGIFMGFNWQMPWGIELKTYSDVFSFPWLSYSADKPVRGAEQLAELSWSNRNDVEVLLRYHYEQKEKNFTLEDNAINTVQNHEKQNLRLQGRFKLSETLGITTRFEWCQSGFIAHEINTGYLVFTDFVYKPKKQTSISFRYAFFNIVDFDARIYAYENDVLYSFTVPSYSGNGQKFYLLLKQALSAKTTLWLRYEYLKEFNVGTIDKHGVKCQFIARF
jgi:hypothetical protein